MTPPTGQLDARADLVAALHSHHPGAQLDVSGLPGRTSKDVSDVAAFAAALGAFVADVHARLDRGDRYALADAVDTLTDQVVADAAATLKT